MSLNRFFGSFKSFKIQESFPKDNFQEFESFDIDEIKFSTVKPVTD